MASRLAWSGLAGLIVLLALPGAGLSHPISPPDYRITERDPTGDFQAPVTRVEDVTFDSLAGRWCFINDLEAAFGCTDKSGTVTQSLNRSDFEAYLAGEGVADPQLYVRETEMIAYDAQGDRLYVGNNVSGTTLCPVVDLPTLFRLTRSSPANNWEISDYWLLPSMNDCPPDPPLVFHYEGLIAVEGVIFFQTSWSYTSAGGELVVPGIYEFDLTQNEFVNLNSPTLAYDTSGGFATPRRIEYDALEGQVYVMEYSGSTPDEMRLLQIDWPSRTAVFETDLIDFGWDPPASGFLYASRGVGVDSASKRIRIGNNDSTDPNSLMFVMRLAHHTQQIVSTYGDFDGFGFSAVADLNDATGAPADRDGNGILDEGDALPDLNDSGSINPGTDDLFDNRSGDPLLTDVGMTQSVDMVIPFTFQIPPGHAISSATFRITVGDASFINKAHHRILVDGIDTGDVLEPRDPGPGGDGLIGVAEVFFESANLAILEDGAVDVVITYATHPDDIAVDYAELTVMTVGATAVPTLRGVWLGVLLGLLVLAGAVMLRRAPLPRRNSRENLALSRVP